MKIISFVYLLLIILSSATLQGNTQVLPGINKAQLSQAQAFTQKLTHRALLFMENKGQLADASGVQHPEVLFEARTGNVRVGITATSLHYQFDKTSVITKRLWGKNKTQDKDNYSTNHEAQGFSLQLLNASPNPQVYTEQQSGYTENYYTANCPDGIIGVHGYEKITLKNIYPAIDWVIYSVNGFMEYDFVLHPGADVTKIRFVMVGADRTILMPGGKLQAATRLGQLTQQQPKSFDEQGKVIPTYFVRCNDGSWGFRVLKYDSEKGVRIDPSITWATYYGGSNYESGGSSTVDGAGNVYFAGTTSSNGLAFNGYQNEIAGTEDAFLVKFDAAGNRLWATYYGGAGREKGLSCSTDGNGNVFLAGYTNSSSGVAAGGFKNNYGGGSQDAFLVKFSATGSRLWATYYGGSGDDYGGVCSTDKDGNIYIAGTTNSTTDIASAGFQNSMAGDNDAFLVKFTGAGSRVWATYYGGNKGALLTSCATDKNRNVYIAGFTESTSGIASGGFQNTLSGTDDAYLAKFDAEGNRLWATYYGGTSADVGNSCAVDDSDNVYLAGNTSSYYGIASGGFQNTIGFAESAYLVKFKNSGIRVWATYCGGPAQTNGEACVADKDGNVYLVGRTLSWTDITSGGFQNSYGGNMDGFIVKVSPDCMRLWATYYGGTEYDELNTVAVGAGDNIYVGGVTFSASGIAAGGFQNVYSGNSDAWLAKINGSGALPLILTSFTGSLGKQSAILNWKTASEVNTSYFNIERSGESSNAWQKIATVQAKGHQNNDYDYFDAGIKPNNVYYYRLKIVDKDGSFAYSKTINLQWHDINTSTVIYPNPAKGICLVRFTSGTPKKCSITIISSEGKIVQQLQVSATVGLNKIPINITGLAKGMYLVNIALDKKEQLKFVVE